MYKFILGVSAILTSITFAKNLDICEFGDSEVAILKTNKVISCRAIEDIEATDGRYAALVSGREAYFSMRISPSELAQDCTEYVRLSSAYGDAMYFAEKEARERRIRVDSPAFEKLVKVYFVKEMEHVANYFTYGYWRTKYCNEEA